MSLEADFIAAQRKLIQLAGNNYTLRDTAGATRTVRGVLVPFDANAGELVNAIDIDTGWLQCEAINPPPVKFDQAIEPVTNRVFTIEFVETSMINNTLIGYRCKVKAL